MAITLPLGIRVAVGLLGTAIDRIGNLPGELPALGLTLAGQAVRTSMRVRQEIAELATRGDDLLAGLIGGSEEHPAWATFDEDDRSEGEPGSGAPSDSSFHGLTDSDQHPWWDGLEHGTGADLSAGADVPDGGVTNLDGAASETPADPNMPPASAIRPPTSAGRPTTATPLKPPVPIATAPKTPTAKTPARKPRPAAPVTEALPTNMIRERSARIDPDAAARTVPNRATANRTTANRTATERTANDRTTAIRSATDRAASRSGSAHIAADHQFTIAQLKEQLVALDSSAVRELLQQEETGPNRAAYLTLLGNRLSTLAQEDR